jgi:cytoskeleton protein RodZ
VTLPAAGVGAHGSVGARLRSARERAGLSPIQAAEQLHVDTGTLEALEAEQFERLGAPVYVRGYILHYADLVGESRAELQELYAASAHAARTPDLTHIPRVESTRPSGTLLLPGMAVVIAVALIGTAWWISGNVGGSRLQRGRPVFLLGSAPASARAHGAAAGQAGTTGEVPQTRSDIATLPADAALLPGGQGPGAAQQGGDVGPPAPAQVGNAPRGRTAALEMRFTEDSWTEVYDARGARLFYDVGFAGSTRTVSGVPPLRVVLGNPPEVALQLDGRPVTVPGGVRNVIAEFRINRSGRVAPVRLAAADGGASGDRKRPDPEEIH